MMGDTERATFQNSVTTSNQRKKTFHMGQKRRSKSNFGKSLCLGKDQPVNTDISCRTPHSHAQVG